MLLCLTLCTQQSGKTIRQIKTQLRDHPNSDSISRKALQDILEDK